jgi:hypothetical protein
MLCASRVPSEALLPIAATHSPLLTAPAVAVELTAYVVADVVVTDREAAAVLPNPWVFKPICDPVMLVTVPVAPPAKPPKPPAPRWVPPGAPVGRVVGAPEGRTPPAPPGRPPAGPCRAEQAAVPVTVTLVALMVDVVDGDGGEADERGVPELIATQSPTATDDRDPVATLVNRVEVAHATTVVAEPEVTLTPEAETAVALPDAAVKFAKPPPPPLVEPPAVPVEEPALAELAPPLPDPQAATKTAVRASPAAGSTRERVVEDELVM